MKNKRFIVVKRYHFPCGDMILGAIDGRLCLCDWTDGLHRTITDFRLQKMLKALFVDGESDVIETARTQLNEYFQGKRREFDVPLLFLGSDFQKSVWDELVKIPYGTTVTYGDIAQRLGNPRQVRAVANACGVNALCIIAPCHRVIGSHGKLTGYSGGLDKKQYLLDLEHGF